MNRRRIALVLTAVALCSPAGCSGDGSAGPEDDSTTSDLDPDVAPVTAGTWYRPPVDVTWQWQLDGVVNTSYQVDLFDLDYEQPVSVIQTLHGRGIKVLCYFSAGSAEDWRPDYSSFPSSAIGKRMGSWAGERYVDIRREAVYSVMLGRLDVAAAKGCDGVELDNVITYEDDTGFPLTRLDQIAYNRNLANAARTRGLAVALKNGGDLVADLLAYFDLELNEECHQYNECGDYTPFLESGKPILNAEYASTAQDAAARKTSLCASASQAGTRTLILPLELDDSFRVSCF